MLDIIHKSATEILFLLQSRQITSVELTEQFIQQIHLVNPSVNAIVLTKFEEALARAHQCDQQRDQGNVIGSLHGLPMTIKDMINTEGDVTTFGTLGLKNHTAKTEGTIVSRLRQAGAILLGKTNVPEFAHGADTDNLVYGRTANPYNLNYSAGGSSGGSAAAVAASCTSFDIGSDAGGSLRIPAHYCGVATIRPTLGRVPSTGIVTGVRMGLVSQIATDGPIAKSACDLSLLLPIIAGEDCIDPNVIPVALGVPNKVDVSKLNIAYYTDNGIVSADNDTAQSITALIDNLHSSVGSVTGDKPENLQGAFDLFYNMFGAAGDSAYRGMLELFKTKQPSPMLEKLMHLLSKKTCDSGTFLKYLLQWDQFKQLMLQFLTKYDVLICPVTARPAIREDQCMWDADMFPSISYSWPYSLTRCPVAVVRVGTSSDGLPIGVQIISKPWTDHVVLAVAEHIETLDGCGWERPSALE